MSSLACPPRSCPTPPERSSRGADDPPPEPWASLFRALDGLLGQTLELHCIGGFAVTMQYGVSRATADVDVLAASTAPQQLEAVQRLAGKGTALHRQFKVYIQPVAVAPYPESYRSRLIRMW